MDFCSPGLYKNSSCQFWSILLIWEDSSGFWSQLPKSLQAQCHPQLCKYTLFHPSAITRLFLSYLSSQLHHQRAKWLWWSHAGGFVDHIVNLPNFKSLLMPGSFQGPKLSFMGPSFWGLDSSGLCTSRCLGTGLSSTGPVLLRCSAAHSLRHCWPELTCLLPAAILQDLILQEGLYSVLLSYLLCASIWKHLAFRWRTTWINSIDSAGPSAHVNGKSSLWNHSVHPLFMGIGWKLPRRCCND